MLDSFRGNSGGMSDRVARAGLKSRRDFLRGTAAVAVAPLLASIAGCASSNVPPPATPTKPSAPTPTTASVDTTSKAIAIDMHNHVYPTGTEPHRGGGPPGSSDDAPALSISDELKQSGFTAVCASFVIDFANNQKPGDARTNLLHWFDAVDAELEKGHLKRALNLKDLEDARDHGMPTIIQSVEGAHFIEGDLTRVEEVYKRGLRHLQLLHEKDDMVSPLGDTNTGVAHLGGLTAFGTQVVKECNRLGILVDLAHASHDTVVAALKIATQPVIVSHTNLDTWAGKDARMAGMMKPRLITKEHAKVIADAGGVVGVWTHLTGSLSEFVESIKAMVDAIGVDHVGIGTDTDLLNATHGTNRAYAGLSGGFFNAAKAEMQRQGFTADDTAKIGGGNYCRVFGKATADHS